MAMKFYVNHLINGDNKKENTLKTYYLIFNDGYEYITSAENYPEALRSVKRGLPAFSIELKDKRSDIKLFNLQWRDGTSINIEAPCEYAAIIKAQKGIPLDIREINNDYVEDIINHKTKTDMEIMKETMNTPGINKELLHSFNTQEKYIELLNSVIMWWEEHKYDTTFDGEYNLYDDEPEFVTIAKELLVGDYGLTYDDIISRIRKIFNKD